MLSANAGGGSSTNDILEMVLAGDRESRNAPLPAPRKAGRAEPRVEVADLGPWQMVYERDAEGAALDRNAPPEIDRVLEGLPRAAQA